MRGGMGSCSGLQGRQNGSELQDVCKGYGTAQIKNGHKLLSRSGVLKDLSLAYAWYNIMTANGEDYGIKFAGIVWKRVTLTLGR